MRCGAMLLTLAGLLMAGCSDDTAGGGSASKSSPAGAEKSGGPGMGMGPGMGGGPGGPPGGGAGGPPGGGPPGGGPGGPPGGPGGAPAAEVAETPPNPKPVAIAAGAVTLVPDSTRIEFIGTHLGARPDPRVGGFAKFTGKAEVDVEARLLKSVSIDIDTQSLWTQIDRLTNHLKSADFFDAEEQPKAAFESTFVATADGKTTITGNLTLHGVTKEISFLATVSITDEGLTLVGKFSIDRIEFGMNYGPQQVEKMVSLTVVIGEKTEIKQGGGGFGFPGGGKGGGRGGPGGGPGGPGGRPPGAPSGAPGAAG